MANFYEDVRDEDTMRAERVVLETLRANFENIEDVSKKNLAWDFIIHYGEIPTHVDAKFDKNYEDSGRIPFETHNVYPSGRMEPKWGVHPGLDFIAIVPWTFSKVVLVPLGSLGRYIAFKLKTVGEERLVKREDWARWATPNYDRGGVVIKYTTHGIAVPQTNFEAYLKHYGAPEILVLDTDSSHRRSKPRLLMGGKEVS